MSVRAHDHATSHSDAIKRGMKRSDRRRNEIKGLGPMRLFAKVTWGKTNLIMFWAF